jgi:tetratricopeptide (TPR) repeat protein
MSGQPRRDGESFPWRRLSLLLLLGGIVIAHLAMSLWSVAESTRFGRVLIGGDSYDAGWGELSWIRNQGGARLWGVYDGDSPIEQAGLRNGDLVVAVNGRRVVRHPIAWLGPRYWGRPGDTLAVSYVRGWDLDGATRQAAAIETLSPFEGALTQAQLHEARGDAAQAEQELRRAVESDTSAAQTALNRLGILLMRQKRPADAAMVYRRMVARDSTSSIALYRLGESDLLANQELTEAERCFRRHLGMPPKRGEPTLASAHWLLGRVLDARGRHAEALAELKRAVDLEPYTQEFARTLWRSQRWQPGAVADSSSAGRRRRTPQP